MMNKIKIKVLGFVMCIFAFGFFTGCEDEIRPTGNNSDTGGDADTDTDSDTDTDTDTDGDTCSIDTDSTSGGGYFEFASFSSGSTDFKPGVDVGCYKSKLYTHSGSQLGSDTTDLRIIDVYSVSIPDIDKNDETPFLEGTDGIYGTADDTSNPEYQQRTLTYERTFNLTGGPSPGKINEAGIYITSSELYIMGMEPDLLHFSLDGTYIDKAVDHSTAKIGSSPFSEVGYDNKNNVWYGMGQDRKVYSSTGDDWVFEFEFPNMSGTHGDGMEVVVSPSGTVFVYVSDMTSNFIGQWAKGDDPCTSQVETGWNEWNRFKYSELINETEKEVEGMCFGPLGHFWISGFAMSGSFNFYLYELGGGKISGYVPVPVPE